MRIDGISEAWLWAGFTALVGALLALDLGVFHRRPHAVGRREALGWSAVWVALSLAFAGLLYRVLGATAAQEYLAGWAIEKSLSIDNLFVMLVIFQALRIPALEQHRVLFIGIVTALVLRAAMIVGGAALLERFHWVVYALGAFLLLTGLKLWRHRADAPDAGGGGLTRWLRRVVPSTPELHGHRFLVRQGGRWLATPLLLALAAVELSDLAFALDSIPAIFAVTREPFIVFTANAFAMLGLRSLYFVLADLAGRFRHLRAGLAAILAYVGVKMIAAPWVKIPAGLSLGVILAILAVAIGWSLLEPAAGLRAAPPGRSPARASKSGLPDRLRRAGLQGAGVGPPR